MPSVWPIIVRCTISARRAAFHRFRLVRANHCVFAVLLLLLTAPAAFSQTGGIAGTVRDQRQGVIAGVKVSVRSSGNQVVASQVTKADGTFLFSTLAPGTYDVEAQAGGFKISINHGVRVGVGESASLDIALTLETLTSNVTVDGTAEQRTR